MKNFKNVKILALGTILIFAIGFLVVGAILVIEEYTGVNLLWGLLGLHIGRAVGKLLEENGLKLKFKEKHYESN